MAAEMEALRLRSGCNPNLDKRRENLRARLESGIELKLQMTNEIGEALRNVVCIANLVAAEFSVEKCYRVRLESLGVRLPRNRPLTADEINAALLTADIDNNRKWLRELLRAHFENRSDWRQRIEGNVRWIDQARKNDIKVDYWLAPTASKFVTGKGEIELRLESEPIKILQMGNYFGTCLSRGGINSFSSVANAVELNKRVVFARDEKNKVIGRQLIAISTEGKLVGFHLYTHFSGKEAVALRAAFRDFSRDLAAKCNIQLGDEGEVEKLFVTDWYDDGMEKWSILDPPRKGKKKSKRCG